MIEAAGSNGYPLLEVTWTILVIFGLILWFALLFRVFGDVFTRQDLSGWAKTGWTLFVLVLPFLGALIYLIVNGQEMAEREVMRVQRRAARYDAAHGVPASSNGSATAEIAKAKDLLDSGSISQAEFDALKQKALAA